MKLRNCKTGEIIEFDAILLVRDVSGDSVAHLEYGSLAELNAEWENVPEEPKKYWFIDFNGEVKEFEVLGFEWQGWMEEIGNRFETKEEAEQAVEKLKAWKRLKDKGFRFDGYDVANRVGDDAICGQVYFKAGNYDKEEIENDLYLLFSGGGE